MQKAQAYKAQISKNVKRIKKRENKRNVTN